MPSVLFKRIHPLAKIPKYQTLGAAGMDVCSVEDVDLQPGEVKAVSLGFAVAVPDGYELQVRPRSGLSLKGRIAVLNSPGTIDSDYRGECKVILTNFGKNTFVIKPGDRIAQFVLNQVERADVEEVFGELPETERGAGGFGSTGV